MSVTNVGTGIGDLGGAVGDLFTGLGDEASASAYSQAAGYAGTGAAIAGGAASLAGGAATIAQTSANLQATQTEMQVQGALGTERSDVAGAGLTGGGTNQYMLAQSAQQGALSVGLIKQQGALNVIGYQEQQEGFEEQQQSLLAQSSIDTGLSQAAKDAALGNFIGGALKGVAGAFSLGAL